MPVFTPELIARHAQTIAADPAPSLASIGNDDAMRKRAVRFGIPKVARAILIIGTASATVATVYNARRQT